MARHRDPQTGKLLPEGIHPVVSQRTGKVTYRARADYQVGKKRVHLSKTCKTAEFAIEWKLENDLLANRGQTIDPSMITIDDYFAQWIKRQKKSWSGARYLQAEQSWRVHARPLLTGMRMRSITRAHLQQLADHMSLTLKPNSIRAYLATFRTMFRHAEEEEIISISPYRSIRIQAVEPTDRAVWSPLQLRYFLSKTKDHRYGAFWAFLIATGCRVSEAIALKPDAVDLDAGVVEIWRTEAIMEDGTREIVERTKTKRRHSVKLEPWILEILGARMDSEFVFMVDGERISYHSAAPAFVRAGKKLGLPYMTTHGIRHSVATMMSSAGVDLAIIKSIVGHANIQTTANTYIKSTVTGQEIGTKTVAHLLGFDTLDTTTSAENEAVFGGNASESRQN